LYIILEPYCPVRKIIEDIFMHNNPGITGYFKGKYDEKGHVYNLESIINLDFH